MVLPRHQQVSLESTRYYHIVCRCVRRAFLCGDDPLTGKNFDHRKNWITARLQLLTSCFAIKICAYAIMSNHFHLVIYVDKEATDSWSGQEVIDRWKKLFPKSSIEDDSVLVWRDRLSDLSWYMRCLNEHIAREANREDKCRGRFWEGRFKSQALLDEGSLLACMTYVDLNPIRAGMSKTPEESEFTSIYERIHEHMEQDKSDSETSKNTQYIENKPKSVGKNKEEKQTMFLSSSLMSFFSTGNDETQTEAFLPFQQKDYLELVDWSGRFIREGKRGSIPAHLKPIIERLHIKEIGWVSLIQQFNRCFFTAAGEKSSLDKFRQRIGTKRIRGTGKAKELFEQAA